MVSSTPRPSYIFCTRRCCAHASIELRLLRCLQISRDLLPLDKSRLPSCRSILNMFKKRGEGMWTAFVWLKTGSSGGLLVTISRTNNRVLIVKKHPVSWRVKRLLDTTVVHGIKSTVLENSFLVGCDVTHDDGRTIRYRNTSVAARH